MKTNLPDPFEFSEADTCREYVTPAIQSAGWGDSTGTNARRRRLNPTDFLKLKIPVPSMATQRKLAAIRLHQSQIHSVSTEAESGIVLDALLNKLLSQ